MEYINQSYYLIFIITKNKYMLKFKVVAILKESLIWFCFRIYCLSNLIILIFIKPYFIL
jgi:hypothetical protein